MRGVVRIGVVLPVPWALPRLVPKVLSALVHVIVSLQAIELLAGTECEPRAVRAT